MAEILKITYTQEDIENQFIKLNLDDYNINKKIKKRNISCKTSSVRRMMIAKNAKSQQISNCYKKSFDVDIVDNEVVSNSYFDVDHDFDDMKIETFNTLSISELHPKVARAYSNLDIADVFNKNYNIRISK